MSYSELEALLTTLSNKRFSLQQQLNALDAQIDLVRADYHRLSNQSAPFFSLPSELIISIFELGRTIWRSPIPFEIVASHVSAYWRQLILHTPHFWTTIDVIIRGPRHKWKITLHKMEAYLSRSGPCPVDILLNVAVPDQEPASVAVCLLLPHSTRWRRLCFISSYDMSSNLAPFYRVSAPNLEYISLRTGELIEEASSSSRIYPNCPSPVPQILNDVPLLTFVRLAGAALWKLQPPMHGITILDLEGSPSMYMTAQQLQSFLATTPSLVSLSLSRYNIVAQQEHLEVIPMQPMCSLRYMRICHEETRAGDLVSLMGLPVIETFKLQDLDSFNCRVLPSVHSITFIACSLSHIELRDITHSFPSLLSLTMDQSVQVLYTVLGFPAGEMLPWPSLEMITIYDLIPINVDMFCNMIHSRCHVKSKLKTVRLNRRSRMVLRSKGRLEWLCALVHVESYDLDEVWPPNMQCYDPDDSWNN